MVYPNRDLGPVQSAVQTVKVLIATVQIAAIRSVAIRNVMADCHCQAEKAATVAHSFVVGRYVAFRRVAVEARFVEEPRREAPVHFFAAVVDR